MLYSSFMNVLRAPAFATAASDRIFSWFLIGCGVVAVIGVAIEVYMGRRSKRG